MSYATPEFTLVLRDIGEAQEEEAVQTTKDAASLCAKVSGLPLTIGTLQKLLDTVMDYAEGCQAQRGFPDCTDVIVCLQEAQGFAAALYMEQAS